MGDGTGDLSSRYLSSAYIARVVTFAVISTCLVMGVHIGLDIEAGATLFALLPPASVKDKRWVLLARVSTDGQLDNTSTKKQLHSLRERAEESNGDIVDEIEVAESGAEMDRESLNRILEEAENDEFDILAIWKLDRLTRSDPWAGVNYLRKLRQHDIILYSHDHGFFDWESRDDFRILIREVLFSREWYSRIKENAEEGQLDYLKQGKYPFGDPHFGYEKDDEDYVFLTDEGDSVIPDVFESYLETENRAETRRRVNSNHDGTELSDSQVKTILKSPRCIGQLTLKGEVVNNKPNLQCVSKATFNRAQEILEDRQLHLDDGEVIPEPIDRATKRFGPEFIGTLFDTLNTVCPDCDGSLEKTNSTTTVKNRILTEYDCTDCDFRGPLFSQEAIDKLDSTIPLACPFCVTIDNVSGERISSSVLGYLYTCNNCGNQFAVDVPPNIYQRAFENPDLAFRWDPGTNFSEENTDQVSPENTVFIWGDTILSDDGSSEGSNDDDDDDDDPAIPHCTVD
ncbi:recombinase family protein [Haloarcula marina]|uniref:recombinase family protein n=1 Tax=Haloarcula marina TaxID=2961574 RepID=UPI003D688C5E